METVVGGRALGALHRNEFRKLQEEKDRYQRLYEELQRSTGVHTPSGAGFAGGSTSHAGSSSQQVYLFLVICCFVFFFYTLHMA